MADFDNPKNTNAAYSLMGYIREAVSSVAKMFDGTSDTNIPTGAKKIDGSTKAVSQWNGAGWDSLGFVNDTADAGAAAASAAASASAASAVAATALSTAEAGGAVNVFISAAGSGDNSGSDASNYMPYATFLSLYTTDSAIEAFPLMFTRLNVFVKFGDSYNNTNHTVFSDLDIYFYNSDMTSTILIEFTGGNVFFYRCRVSGFNCSLSTNVGGFTFEDSIVTVASIAAGGTGQIIVTRSVLKITGALLCYSTFTAFLSDISAGGALICSTLFAQGRSSIGLNGNLVCSNVSSSLISTGSTVWCLNNDCVAAIDVKSGAVLIFYATLDAAPISSDGFGTIVDY